MSNEVCFENHLEFKESRWDIGANELVGKECDCMGDSERKRLGCERGHCVVNYRPAMEITKRI